MSKRCELQKEYHREHGNYKGVGKYSDHYVNWLESKILALNIQNVSNCSCISRDTLTPEARKMFDDIDKALERKK